MLPSRSLKLLIAAGAIALAVSACGRRGALEPPDGAARPGPVAGGPQAPASARSLPTSIGLGNGAASPDPAAVQAGDELPLSAIPPSGTEAPQTTGRGARRGYTVPRQPFLLDPLL
ncbi:MULTISPECIES: LPS translocon maturation chaperone LptM [Methylobacterium]|uniref:LPS translocon maturation chaperone LptM n=1 Tax=Methylobacterium TaxID=407 RepID=UPI001051109B|nr:MULTISPECIES: lipoprotein [Methylobacterium]MDR7038846.1 putative small lipoprotein YifL [Methylobacterium sp. BE186]